MSIIEYINTIVKLPEEIQEEVAASFRLEKYAKRVVLEHAGVICNKLYFIEKGLARLFYEKDGKDITGWFASEKHFISCNDSFFQRIPSHLNLELLEDSVLYSIDYEGLNRLFDKFKEMERFGRLLTYNLLSELSERIYSTLFQPAEKRYQLLVVRYPEVALRAPLGDIASYLGISQETLSRIRSQQTTKSKGAGVYK